MRKTRLTTISVLVLGLAFPAFAESQPGDSGESGFFSYREIEGTMEVGGDDLDTISGYLDSNVLNANEVTIGWVEDLLIDPESRQATHVVVDLRMEGKFVALPIEAVRPAPKHRDALRTDMTDPALAALPPYEPLGEVWALADDMDGGMTTASGPSEEATQSLMTATGQLPTDIGGEDIIGRTILTTDGSRAGEVGDLVLNKDKAITHVLVDVGGFLGFGQKRVSVPVQAVSLAQERSLFVDMTEKQLEALPEYKQSPQ